MSHPSIIRSVVATSGAAGLVLASFGIGASALSPSPTGTTDDGYGYADFYAIPHLGDETASGTGCGGDGSVGDTIPDGYWRGYVTADDGINLEFDLVCVYGPQVNPDLITRWRSLHPDQPDPTVPDGFLVNADTRTRTVPVASSFFSHGTATAGDGTCPFDQPDVAFDASHDAWIHIVDGQAQWAVSSCSPPAPETQPAPTTGFTFPYLSFTAVPQLGDEPVRGTGCGGDGSLGDTIPDGFWYGRVTSQGDSSLEFDVMCWMYGPEAEQMRVDYFDQKGTEAPYLEGFVINNSTRIRTVPTAPGFLVATADDTSRQDPNWPDLGSGEACVPPLDPSQLAYDDVMSDVTGGTSSWIYIADGAAQYALLECPHD